MSSIDAMPKNAMRCVNIVNFIRGVEPRFETDLLLPVRKQMEIIVAKGKKRLVFDPRRDSRETILRETLGRSGTLRAPTLRIGDRLLVGYNDELYAQFGT